MRKSVLIRQQILIFRVTSLPPWTEKLELQRVESRFYLFAVICLIVCLFVCLFVIVAVVAIIAIIAVVEHRPTISRNEVELRLLVGNPFLIVIIATIIIIAPVPDPFPASTSSVRGQDLLFFKKMTRLSLSCEGGHRLVTSTFLTSGGQLCF